MIDVKKRLDKIEKEFLLKEKFFHQRAFENYTDQELIKHIKDSIEDTHRKESIKDYVGAVEYYKRICKSDGISEEDLKLHLQMEKEYFLSK